MEYKKSCNSVFDNNKRLDLQTCTFYSIIHLELHSDVQHSDIIFQDSSPHRHDLGSHEERKNEQFENITQVRLNKFACPKNGIQTDFTVQEK